MNQTRYCIVEIFVPRLELPFAGSQIERQAKFEMPKPYIHLAFSANKT
jgi:hypothetical protein